MSGPIIASVASVPDARAHASRLVAELGLQGAAQELGLSREAVLRVVGGVPTQKGTRAIIEQHAAKAETRT